jgi:hypothetical protein
VRGACRWERQCPQSTAPAPTPSCPQTRRACAPFLPAWVRPLCARHVLLGKCVGGRGWVRGWGHVASQKLWQQPRGLGYASCDPFAPCTLQTWRPTTSCLEVARGFGNLCLNSFLACWYVAVHKGWFPRGASGLMLCGYVCMCVYTTPPWIAHPRRPADVPQVPVQGGLHKARAPEGRARLPVWQRRLPQRRGHCVCWQASAGPLPDWHHVRQAALCALEILLAYYT